MHHEYCRAAPAKHASKAFLMQGFTLVELMVTIAVAAILLGIATPSFTSIINNNRLTAAANEMVATLQTARLEAVRRNRSVTVCSSANGSDCAGEGSWIVLDGANVLRVSSFNANVRPTATVNEFAFRADGLARIAAGGALLQSSFDFCIDTTMPVRNARTVSIGSGSRISTATPDAAIACP